VWLAAEHRGETLWLAGASDAAIVAGLVALVLRVYSGRDRDEILATPPKFLHDLGLIGALSTNRGNGVAAMVERIQVMAKKSGP
jgi:cysteine desulfuration protein SufE